MSDVSLIRGAFMLVARFPSLPRRLLGTIFGCRASRFGDLDHLEPVKFGVVPLLFLLAERHRLLIGERVRDREWDCLPVEKVRIDDLIP